MDKTNFLSTRSKSLTEAKMDLKLHPVVEGIYDSGFIMGYNALMIDILEGKYPEIIVVEE